MARIGMIHAVAGVRTNPHAPLDNANTKFNSVRLLKGAPPGRVRSYVLSVLYTLAIYYLYTFKYLYTIYILRMYTIH